MESLNALLQGMGLMRTRRGSAIMLLVSSLPAGDSLVCSSRCCCCRLASAACSQHPGSGHGADRAGKPAGASRTPGSWR
ncbi:hypothetical protein KCP75_24840 [Salmonella enterica subsp. enterica]|nr:hypothetical protein KCP75_24840 [Salmonella enterica subsp. enterica]